MRMFYINYRLQSMLQLYCMFFYQAGATHKNKTDFLIEASVMGQFKNLNVITLEGVVTRSKFRWM